MRCKGIIKKVNQIVVTDPHYLQDVSCRYDKFFNTKEDWIVEIIIKDVNEIQEYKGYELEVKGLDFCIMIKRENVTCDLLDIGKFLYKKGTEIKETEIGIDTAQVCMGINEKAKEINNFATKINKENDFEDIFAEYNPDFAIQTMSDGIFGFVREGIKNGETDFICITGFFDEYADVNVDELKEYIIKQLNVKNLEIQKDFFNDIKNSDVKEEDKDEIDY